MNDMELQQLATQLGTALSARGWLLCCAESCTGGWIAKAVTDVAGSSIWFERGFVTYSDRAKQDMLGVSEYTLAMRGAVSEQTVREMVRGAVARSRAQIGVAVSGVAGPGGGSAEKPLGSVWLAWADPRGIEVEGVQLTGDREAIRRQTVVLALQGLLTRTLR